MTAAQLTTIRRHFKAYADARIGAVDRTERIPLVLKRAHTLRVASDANSISAELGWPDGDRNTAQAIAFLHDVARFDQFIKYRTFSDQESFDHGEKACEIIQFNGWLSGFEHAEQETIMTSVHYHNRRSIPEGIGGNALEHLKLIRDVDKIDILHTVSMILREGWHLKHPGVLLDVDTEGPVTPELVEQILSTQSGGYENVKTLADIHLMRVAWVYSISYKPALRKIIERGLYSSSIERLPGTPEIEEICRRASAYIRDTLGAGPGHCISTLVRSERP